MNGYDIRIRVVDAPWNTFVYYQQFGNTPSFRNITGLSADTHYEWQVRAFCTPTGAGNGGTIEVGVDVSGWQVKVYFITDPITIPPAEL